MSGTKNKRRLNVLPDNPEQRDPHKAVGPGRFPSWLHRKLPQGNALWHTQEVLNHQRLPTVCEEAKCPNLLECWSKKTATFLAMGKECTRNCGFCSIDFQKAPKPLDPEEPERLADSVQLLGLNHVVITMVARDDLEDGGASHLVSIIQRVKKHNPHVTVEVLTSDFAGKFESLTTLLAAPFEIFNHNIETVRSLTPRVRHKATYDRTLSVLQFVHQNASHLFIKSGLMVGLGETDAEVKQTMHDLLQAGCQLLTIGHYLQPNRQKLRVKEFISEDQFNNWADYGRSIGFVDVYAAPFVRSSYNAASLFQKIRVCSQTRN